MDSAAKLRRLSNLSIEQGLTTQAEWLTTAAAELDDLRARIRTLNKWSTAFRSCIADKDELAEFDADFHPDQSVS